MLTYRRWLRLLFGREFPRTEIPQLWGFLFSAGPLLPHLHYLLVAMLLAVRNTCELCDFAIIFGLETFIKNCYSLPVHKARLAQDTVSILYKFNYFYGQTLVDSNKFVLTPRQ